MRIAPRLLAALALAAGFLPEPAAAQMPVRGVLFAVSRGENGEGVLEPVTILVPDGFDMPMHLLLENADSVQRAFNARWLNPGRAYDVLYAGERVGRIRVRTPDEPACMSMTARGALDVRTPPRSRWHGLAGEGLPAQTGAPWLRDPSAEEKRALDHMAAELLDAHGIDVARRTRGDTATAVLRMHPNARPVLVASYTLDEPGPMFQRASMMIVAEEGENGYRPSYAWFHDGIEGDVETRELVDAADLDGDGMPELVLRVGYYESWDFIILRRTKAGWFPVYRGGGGGC